jgi:DNA-binding HxlR family transcriptional regulator
MTSKKSGPCPLIVPIKKIGSQWRLTILSELLEDEKRFNELKRSTEASSRTLSRVLDHLVEEKLVEKRIEEESPIATYYSLTDRGKELEPVFEQIQEWGNKWVTEEEIQESD